MSNSVAQNKRVEYIDLFRSFGILLMIIGHINFGARIDHFMHAFHMPMFFFISGYFYKENTGTGAFVRKKVKTLLIPYFSFALLYTLCAVFYEGVILKQGINYGYFIHMLWDNTDGTALTGVLWFLTALFFTEVIYHLIRKYIREDVIVHITILILYVFGLFATRILPFRLPWALDAAFVGMGFFHAAHLMKKNNNSILVKKLFDLHIIPTIFVGGGISLLILRNSYINMRIGQYGDGVRFTVYAFVAVIVGWNLCRILSDFMLKNKVLTYIHSGLTYIGHNSMTYLCVNQVCISLLELIFLQMGFSASSVLIKLCILILTIIMLTGIDFTVRKSKLRFMIGA